MIYFAEIFLKGVWHKIFDFKYEYSITAVSNFFENRGDIRESAINPFPGFSVIAGVVDTGDKYGLSLI